MCCPGASSLAFRASNVIVIGVAFSAYKNSSPDSTTIGVAFSAYKNSSPDSTTIGVAFQNTISKSYAKLRVLRCFVVLCDYNEKKNNKK